MAISPGGVGPSSVEVSGEGDVSITIELSVPDDVDEEPQDVPSIILSPSLVERVGTVSFDLEIPSEEELPQGLSLSGYAVRVDLLPPDGEAPQGLRLEGAAAKAGAGGALLGEGEAVRVCLPAPSSFEDEPSLYRYKEGREWTPLPGSSIETVNDIESVCADVSSFPSLVGVFVEVSEPPVAEGESGGGCSVVSGDAGGSGSFNVVFNLFLIMFGLVSVSRRRRQTCVHRAG